jgi:MYXO-CTERM domain-containing protein
MVRRFAWVSSAVVLFASPALAITQPNGTPIPVGGSVQNILNQEEGGQLIDALAAAAVTPETYKPICNLTVKVIARGAGYNNTFGWYNVNPNGKPPDFDLRSFLECNDGVGTVKVLNIASDPAYLGGEIGFFMATPENANGNCPQITYGVGPVPGTVGHVYYSQRQYNPDNLGPNNSYIHLLTYNSVAHANTFYFGWEDKLSGGDNDFDDLMTQVEGIQCSGGGAPCTVAGQAGQCANGIMQCQNGVLTCVQNHQPVSEACNALDDDCNGSVDEGDLCASTEVCYKGTCVPKCTTGEFKCTGASVCNADGVCVDPQCATVTCDAGQVCVAGTCVAACDGVTCPFGQSCTNGACVDPCTAVVCDSDFVCVSGVCTPKCNCTGCGTATGKTCDTVSGKCEDPACNPNPCGAGTHCVAGTCVDDCDGAACPKGQICQAGTCVLGGGGAGGTGGGGGVGLDGGISIGGGGTGAASGNGGPGGGGNVQGGGTEAADDGGCGCRLSSRTSSWAPVAWSLIGLLLLGRRRRHTLELRSK